ncbi:hypothetical protein BOX15_Mlig022012g2 [Macrostomum lignano]|uniref:Uncharacterized protein n=1 Tax=Macrostomum lignano TaxID=282301 RepID=A0A267E298_9PLAT|nr:hypothetical protein BOX15_Mlig022012g2 [Macrostomum lignano]
MDQPLLTKSCQILQRKPTQRMTFYQPSLQPGCLIKIRQKFSQQNHRLRHHHCLGNCHSRSSSSSSSSSSSISPPPKPLPKPVVAAGSRGAVMSPTTRHSYHEAMEAIAFIDDLGCSSSSGSARSSTSTLRRADGSPQLPLPPPPKNFEDDYQSKLSNQKSETLPVFPMSTEQTEVHPPRQLSFVKLPSQDQQQQQQQQQQQTQSSKSPITYLPKPIYRSEKFLDLSAPHPLSTQPYQLPPPKPLPSSGSPCVSRKAKSVLVQRAAATTAATATAPDSAALSSSAASGLSGFPASAKSIDYRSEGEDDDTRNGCRQSGALISVGIDTCGGVGGEGERPATFSASSLTTYAYKKALTPYLFEPLLPEGNRILGIVVAIDIGSTCSGYAYSLHPDPESVRTMHLIEKGYTGVKSHKIPSALLLDSRHNFHSFGYRAREFYYQLARRETRDWLFFEGFKPRVGPNSKLSHSCMVTAANGVSIPLLEVMRHCFAFFRERALSELRVLLPAGFQLRSRDIHWVLPVPSHWPVGGLDLVRRAALETGFAEQKTRLISEAEAAAAFCSAELLIGSGGGVGGGNGLWWSCQPQVVEWVRKNRQEARSLTSATSNSNDNEANRENGDEGFEGVLELIVDCGGATTNLAVQRWDRKGEYKFIAQRGMSSGSTEVDDAFAKLLNDIFDSEFVFAFRSQCPLGYLELLNAFESRKQICSLSRDSAAFLNIPLPFSMISFHKEFKSYGVDQAIRDFADPEILWTSQGMLKISRERMAQLFCPTVNRILRQIGELLEAHRGIQVLLLVGGFQSPRSFATNWCWRLRRSCGYSYRIILIPPFSRAP